MAYNRGMGNAQSQSGTTVNSSKPFDFDSPDIDKNELMTNILVRLLEYTDIVDFLALINGPGTCGPYTIMLEQNLKKEFKQIQLSTTISGKKQSETFLYRQKAAAEAPENTVVCRELALFYIRLLQLIGALTMSIYTPNNLVDRIRDESFTRSVNKQRAPLTYEQLAAQRKEQWIWFSKYLLSAVSGSTELFTIKNKTSFKLIKTNPKMLVYTNSEGYKFEATLELEEMDKYDIIDDNKKPDSYWVVLRHPNKKNVIMRRLVNKDGSAYIFSNEPDVSKGAESAEGYENEWTEMLDTILLTMGNPAGKAQTARANDAETRELIAKLLSRQDNIAPTRRFIGGRRRRNRKTMKGGQNAAVVAKPNFGPYTSWMPKSFKDSYSFLKKWSRATVMWTEAAPASYRATLLFIKPNLPNAAATSYICVDNWLLKSMNQVAPFAALEALYRNKDDGTVGYDNQLPYKNLLDGFNNMYKTGKTGSVKSFSDIYIPGLPDKVVATLCSKSTTQGDVILEEKYTRILEGAQAEILEKYKAHFAVVLNYFKSIFVPGKDAKGTIMVNLSELFTKDSGEGARAELENIITSARGQIAQHYIEVETIYLKAISDITLVP